MKLDIESFDFKYVSDEIMSTLSLAQDYPLYLKYKGPFPACYIFAKDNFKCFCHTVHIFRIPLLLMKILSGIASVSKSLNLDLAQHFVRPD